MPVYLCTSQTTFGGPKLGRAFTLVEAVVAMAVLAVSAVALVGAISWGTNSVGMTRDNQRATQILTERMETIRLYRFDQITDSTFLPKTDVMVDLQKNGTTGKVYTLTISVTNRFLAANYSNDIARVTLNLSWQTGKVQRQRSLSSYVYRHGLQTFVN